jgi:catechol 2,3-dioxygenase-like lactoylglutathione lyase family enzyme
VEEGISETAPNARQTIVTLVELLVKRLGSQAKLVRELERVEPLLQGLSREAVSAWVRGRALPRNDAARALSMLLEDRGKEFLEAHRAAQQESRQRAALQREGEEPRSICVLGLSWLGLRTDDMDAMCDFVEGVLRLHRVHRCEGDHALYRTDNGDFIALYGPKSTRYELFTTGPVIGLRVGNIRAARAEMEARGIQFLGSIHSKDQGRWKYAHFIGPDQTLYELVEEITWPAERT